MLRYSVNRRPIVTLTTDFGPSDGYVGAMKGVLLSIAPDVTIVDISHLVEPQNVAQGAYLLESDYSYFPAEAIHVAVVDPGVGTQRRAIAVKGSHGTFVGPDNGIFWPALESQKAVDSDTGRLTAAYGVVLENPEYRLPRVSRTFHGRDIFAPAAGNLALGVEMERLGPPVSSIQRLPSRHPAVDGDTIRGVVIHVDRFGNIVSNIPASMLPARPVFEVAGRRIRGVADSYQDGALLAIEGSTGLIEIAARNGSAVAELGLKPGDAVTVRSDP